MDEALLNELGQRLDAIPDPAGAGGLVANGRIVGLTEKRGRIDCVVEAPAEGAAAFSALVPAIKAALEAAPGVKEARVVLTAAARTRPPKRARLSEAATEQTRRAAPVPAARPEHVRAVLAVASGKGGVGKSTVAVNLACAFARLGLRAGLLDADVYGPSIPLMLGLTEAPEHRDGKLIPLEAWGVKALSVGLLVDADQALIWRGPMASQALTQMLTQGAWGTADEPLDVLVVDLPPGTGDVQLTLVQKTPIDGAVIVSTPQEAALADARRAHALFQKTGTPVWGLVENMSGEIFGRGGTRAEAERLGAAFLGEVSLDASLRQGGDSGRPVVADQPDGEAAKAFMEMAKALAGKLR
ncbi:Mrp/NBP35 family ATP-binding protein [Brevundimonas sp. 2R-24]|uniref:Iron-sulfur cluster carrier protein n=1 Tax=Peiella sedimenti TaxID=3061083 RepID=A0ABT8SQX8_9CAUL|nr:Mrp/NBP35 family ATP-binding protein [Caulobacteraceae bacterium XZ-24]